MNSRRIRITIGKILITEPDAYTPMINKSYKLDDPSVFLASLGELKSSI
jgi:hypothetical protein